MLINKEIKGRTYFRVCMCAHNLDTQNNTIERLINKNNKRLDLVVHALSGIKQICIF